MQRILFTVILLNLWAFKADQKPNRPNIIWITCEDMSPHLGVYGEKVAKTPYLDNFAKQCTQYNNVFSTAGVCAPSRAAIITGCYQTSVGAHHMRTPIFSQVNLDSYPPNYVGYSAVLPTEVKCFSEHLRKAGYYCTNNDKQDYQFEPPVTAWNESSTKAHWRNRPDKEQPFFSIFNLMVTHESQVWARAKEPLLVKPEDVEVPPYYPDCAEVRTDIARFLSNVMVMDHQVGKIIAQLKEDGLYDDAIIFFYSDHGDGLPWVKRELYDRGLRVPMLIKMPKQDFQKSDNQLISFIDLAPTVLSLAGVPVPKYMQGQAFLGNQKSRESRKYIYAARDRMDSEYDRVRAVSDGRFKYLRNFMPEKPYYQNIKFRLSQPSMQAILKLKNEGKLNEIQKQWFNDHKPNEELFDTQTDPHELTNLAQNQAYALKVKELRKQMDTWLKRYGDMGEIPEMEMVARWWGGSLKNGPPSTEKPEIVSVKSKIYLTCKTKGASIAYKKQSKSPWQVYDEAQGLVLSPADSLYVLAHRIGFKPSEIARTRVDGK
jgi:N-sulfoglucosamine sulfohydrolase